MTNTNTSKLTLTNGSNTITAISGRGAGLTRWVCYADGLTTEQVLTTEAARSHVDRLLGQGWVVVA